MTVRLERLASGRVISMIIRRPSVGSDDRLIRPARSRSATITAIDCGVMNSEAASADEVAGPSLASRLSARLCPMESVFSLVRRR